MNIEIVFVHHSGYAHAKRAAGAVARGAKA